MITRKKLHWLYWMARYWAMDKYRNIAFWSLAAIAILCASLLGSALVVHLWRR